MKTTISTDVRNLFPETKIAVLKGQISGLKGDFNNTLADLRGDALGRAKSSLATYDPMTGHPNIKSWREAYKAFGASPKKFKPTHEAYVRRVARSEEWPAPICPIVDLYLVNQVDHLLPHGGYDLDSLVGDVELIRASGGEIFEPLGGGQESVEAGEVVYRDEGGVLTRRWNYRDCDRTKITAETKHFALMIESPSAQISSALIEAATQSLQEKFEMCFDGEFNREFVTAELAK